ncbi:MAG TPA: hypothetical protein VMS31_01245, partial [Pyrinomonadaceae bacterium]|nr:hypothetical protein [Pyrinomonadaceae bacterium]
SGVRIIFDIRGLMAEEYEDAGVWQRDSAVFRAVKKLERAGLKRADGIVVLTRRMRDWLVGEQLAAAEKIQVIPCCVDLMQYQENAGEDSIKTGTVGEASERFEVVYAGSVTGLYMLEEMGRFFGELRQRRPGAFFRVLTMSAPEPVAAVLRQAGLNNEDFQIGSAAASEVPAILSRARLGISFRKPTFSQIAASPTKISEYLAAGLPVVSNQGIGDTDELLERERVGLVVADFDSNNLGPAAERALALADESGIAERCRAAAEKHFDLDTVGGAGYVELYRRVAV